MIPVSNLPVQMLSWQQQLKNLVRDPDQLIELLQLSVSEQQRAQMHQVAEQFPLRVTHSFIQRMELGNLEDPLLKQVLPLGLEQQSVTGFSNDPLEEQGFSPTPGLVQKYPGRLLVIATGACAIHCRYCFRRHFPYGDHSLAKDQLDHALSFMAQRPDIHEVILSGGDPLMWPTDRLSDFTEQLSQMNHVRTLRVHSRLPVVLPDRLDTEFLQWWNSLPFQRVLVIHANHAAELNDEVGQAVQGMMATQVLNQAVLLKGVNDTVEDQKSLAEQSFKLGVLPYYLHLLDRVQGAGHFEVTEQQAVAIHKQLIAQLPGYLVPRLVREIPGEQAKTPISTG
jgi:EF-P beta-lysylation protein EpmB